MKASDYLVLVYVVLIALASLIWDKTFRHTFKDQS